PLRLPRIDASLDAPRPPRGRRVRRRRMSSIGYVSERSTGSWVSVSVFWLVQVSALLVFFVPFTWGMLALWALLHFSRAIGLTLAFHRYFAHRSFKMGRVTQFFWALLGT